MLSPKRGPCDQAAAFRPRLIWYTLGRGLHLGSITVSLRARAMSADSRFAAIQMQQIRHFVALIDAGGFHRAAKDLGISQPGLTRSIKRLEATLGQEFIARSAKGVSANASGRALYEYGVRVLNETRRMIMEVDEIKGDPGVVIRVGLAANFLDFALAATLADFALHRPATRLIITQGYFPDVLAGVRRGVLDIAISLWPVHGSAPDLVVEPVLRSVSSVICGPHSRFFEAKRATMADLAEAPWVLSGLEEAEGFVSRLFESNGLAPPPILVKTNSFHVVQSILEAQDVVGLVPNITLDALLDGSPLVRIRTGAKEVSADAVMAYMPHITASPRLNALIGTIRHHYRKSSAIETRRPQ